MTDTVYRIASAFDKEYPQEPIQRLAIRAVKSLTEDDRIQILTDLLAMEIDRLRRSRARDIEHRAWLEASKPERKAQEDAARELRREVKQEASIRAKWRREDEKVRQELFERDPEAYRRRYTLGGIIEAFEEEIRGEERKKVSAELLTVLFATGDGRRVTWGEATLEDHRLRIELLGRNIEGNVQTIRLHEHAADILRETGAKCLNQSRAITIGR